MTIMDPALDPVTLDPTAQRGPAAALLDVANLTVTDRAGQAVLDQVSLRIAAGARVGVVGESGAGKTTLALAGLGLIRPGLRHRSGSVRLAGADVLALGERARRRLRRRTTAWLGQDPAAALTPTLSIGRQITELLDPGQLEDGEVSRRLSAVGLPTDALFQRRFPGQLSGGQQQRLALARALAGSPQLLVLDEPTSRLDPATRAMVVRELDRLQALMGFALVVISHDFDLVAGMTDQLLVLRDGRTVEAGPTVRTLRAPTEPYTAALRDAHPDLHSGPASTSASRSRDATGIVAAAGSSTAQSIPQPAPALELRNVSATHGSHEVLTDVSLRLRRGELLALVGASGSGKTTLARCVTGLHPPSAGQVLADGVALSAGVQERSRPQLGALQLIGQDPATTLHPRRAVRDSVARPARLVRGLSRTVAREQADGLLADVGLPEPLRSKLPHQLSGGERQRVAIARALAAEPAVLICDEITSALDPTIAAVVLDLLDELRRTRGLGVLLVTHDLTVATDLADTVAVLDDGRLAEVRPAPDILTAATSAAAQRLVAAMPSLSDTLLARESSPQGQRRSAIEGEAQ